MRVRAVLVSVFLLAAAPVQADEYESKVRQLLHLSGAEQQMKLMVPAMLEQMRPMMQRMVVLEMEKAGQAVDEAEIGAFFERLDAEMVKELDTLYPLVVAEYRKHLDLAEVDALVALMQKPAFQTYAEKVPALTAALQQAGAAWGQGAAERAIRRASAK